MKIVRCPSCDGYGWFEGADEDCDWCAGAGYVYRSAAGSDSPIPPQEYPQVADKLEELEQERLREMGYQGSAKKPWRQQVRKGSRLGRNPYAKAEE